MQCIRSACPTPLPLRRGPTFANPSPMNWSFLWVVGEPWFVIPWYAIGALGALFVIYDLRVNNTVIKPAIGWGWPIIVFFFSVIGLALYFLTARAPGIGSRTSDQEKQQAHNRIRAKHLAPGQRRRDPLRGRRRIWHHDRHGDRPRRRLQLLAGVLVRVPRRIPHRLGHLPAQVHADDDRQPAQAVARWPFGRSSSPC